MRLDNTIQDQTFHIVWNKPINGLQIDPNNWLVNGVGSISFDPALDVAMATKQDFRISPNPANASWLAESLPSHCKIVLFNTLGSVMWKGENGVESRIVIPGDGLAPGIYMLSVQDGLGRKSTFKLNHK